jgi:hypothetical protein
MSILRETPSSTKNSQLPAPEIAQKVFTINQQLITNVYTRKRLKPKKQHVPDSEPVFGPVQQEYSPQAKSGKGLKCNATPISVQDLRRSKRSDVLNKGFKPLSLVTNSSKPKGKRRPLGPLHLLVGACSWAGPRVVRSAPEADQEPTHGWQS